MGSKIEINDTLKISKERGFPRGLVYEEHVRNYSGSQHFLGREFEFWNQDERLYHCGSTGTRVFLVEEMPDGRWLYWGNALVTSQTISNGRTSGKFVITKIYEPEFQRRITVEESPRGKSLFDDKATSLTP